MVISSLKRVAASAVDIEASAAGDKEPEPMPVLVEFPLDPSFPSAPFMKFIEDEQCLIGGPSGRPDFPPVITVIPVQIDARTG